MAVDPTFQSPYFGRNVSLVTLSTPVRLVTLMQAIDPHVPEACSYLRLYGDDANTTSVFIGDDSVSGTNFAYPLAAKAFVEYESSGPIQQVPLGRLVVWTSAAAVLHVEMIA